MMSGTVLTQGEVTNTDRIRSYAVQPVTYYFTGSCFYVTDP